MRQILASLAGLALLASPMVASAKPVAAQPVAMKSASTTKVMKHRHSKKIAGRHARRHHARTARNAVKATPVAPQARK